MPLALNAPGTKTKSPLKGMRSTADLIGQFAPAAQRHFVDERLAASR